MEATERDEILRKEAERDEKIRRRMEREERRRERKMKKRSLNDDEDHDRRIEEEERKLLVAQRKLESIRLLDELLERVKVIFQTSKLIWQTYFKDLAGVRHNKKATLDKRQNNWFSIGDQTLCFFFL